MVRELLEEKKINYRFCVENSLYEKIKKIKSAINAKKTIVISPCNKTTDGIVKYIQSIDQNCKIFVADKDKNKHFKTSDQYSYKSYEGFYKHNPSWAKQKGGANVFDIETIAKENPNMFAIISSPNFHETKIKNNFLQFINKKDIIYFHRNIFYPAFFYEDYETFLEQNIDRIDNIYNLIADELSKNIFKNYIKGLLKKDTDIMQNIDTYPQYFIDDIFTFSKEEVLVDVGAYTGGSIGEFYIHVNGDFKYIYSFELDKNNFEKIPNYIRMFMDENTLQKVKLINKGLYSQNTTCHINSEGASSAISNEASNENTAQLTKLDDEITVPPTFIKMDIEGSELEALKGGAETIRKYKPKLAICCYHKAEDIFELPEFILKLNPNYKIHFRHHSAGRLEFVMYCV